jgi:DNA polymerase-3 subunit beta
MLIIKFVDIPTSKRKETNNMRITCKQADLKKGLSTVEHAVSNRSTLPILANILMATDQGRLKLYATNLEIGISCWIDATIHEEGTTTVPAKTFGELIASLAQGELEIYSSPETHTTNIKSTKSNANVRGMSPDEYPTAPNSEGADAPITLEASLLKEMINQVAFAAAADDSRPVLSGVQVKIDSGKLSMGAADSFRLALREIPLPGREDLVYSDILIPAKTLSELAKILSSDGTVEMIVTPNRSQVLFHTESLDLVSRLIEGTFPNIRAAIPKHLTTRTVLETKDFASAVKMVTPFARDSSNTARVKVTNGITGELTLEANAEDVGDNTATINAAITGDDTSIIFNVKYLSDVLAIIETPEVSLELNSAASPGVIKPVGSAEYVYVIMPMSTNR